MSLTVHIQEREYFCCVPVHQLNNPETGVAITKVTLTKKLLQWMQLNALQIYYYLHNWRRWSEHFLKKVFGCIQII